MSEIQQGAEVASNVTSNYGWAFGALAMFWGGIVKFSLGRHMKSYDDDRAAAHKEREATRKLLTQIDKRLSNIEGRFQERDRRTGNSGLHRTL